MLRPLLADCVDGLAPGLRAGAGVAARLADRHPGYVWLLPLPCTLAACGMVTAVDAGAAAALALCGGAPARPAVLLGWCVVCALLTRPQQTRLHLGVPALACLAAVLALHLQYATAVALAVYPRPLAVLAVGLPNLALTAHVLAYALWGVGAGAAARGAWRAALWSAYTVASPLLCLPQAVLAPLACPLWRAPADGACWA